MEMYPSEYWEVEAILFWLCVLLAGAGVFVLLQAKFGLMSAGVTPDKCFQILPDIPLRNVFPWRRHCSPPLITELPNFGLVFGAILWILLFLWIIARQPIPHYGLAVDFRAGELSKLQKSPWPETLGVYLGADGTYYVNKRPTVEKELHATLERELNRRIVWDVYLEGDQDAQYKEAIYAIDVIQKLGARVIWITPKVRKQLE